MATTLTSKITTPTTTTTKTTFDNNDYNNKKLQLVTAGLEGYFINILKKQSNQNIATIVDYLLALNTEINPSLSHKTNQLKTLPYSKLYQTNEIW